MPKEPSRPSPEDFQKTLNIVQHLTANSGDVAIMTSGLLRMVDCASDAHLLHAAPRSLPARLDELCARLALAHDSIKALADALGRRQNEARQAEIADAAAIGAGAPIN